MVLMVVEASHSLYMTAAMKKRRPKPRLTVIVGAGATTGAVIASLRQQKDRSGKPLSEDVIKRQDNYSTQHLTAKIGRLDAPQAIIAGAPYGRGARDVPGTPPRRYDTQVSVIPWLMQALRAYYRAPNFETLLGVIEDLEMFAGSQYNLTARDEYRFPLNAFLDPLPRHAFLLDRLLLQEARRQIVATLMEHVPDKEHCAATQYRASFDILKKSFDLDVFTLNYDLLLDAALTSDSQQPFDGFIRDAGSNGPAARAFDRPSFIARAQRDPCTLVHLHGCSLFGYIADHTGVIRFDEIVKHHNVNAALSSVTGSVRSENTQNGEILSAGPIISGVNKIAKITATMAPYGYYYQALGNAISSNSRLLIIGYGGADPHVNAWIEQFQYIHGQARRAVVVLGGGASAWLSFAHETALDRLMHSVDNAIPPKTLSHTTGIQTLTEATLLAHDGFPVSAEDTREMVSFFLKHTDNWTSRRA
ncbi:MAG: SIR2 family protein [Gammaproteobacteria bacterium]|nr:SIR2 family protein [Gammaproteobacteria bacterium]